MKKFLLFGLLLILSVSVNAQFKEELNKKVNIKDGFLDTSVGGNVFGFIDPTKFSMSHSVSMSYSAFSGQGIAMGVYTNSMRYDFSDQLNIQVDASIVNSPYNTLGESFTNNLNGIYLSRAALNFKPSENTYISVQFRQVPGSYYNNYYRNPYYYMSPSFDRDLQFERLHRGSK